MHHAQLETMCPAAAVRAVGVEKLLQDGSVIQDTKIMKTKGKHQAEPLHGFVLCVDLFQLLDLQRNFPDSQT